MNKAMAKQFWRFLLTVLLTNTGHAEGLLAIDNPAKNGQALQGYAGVEAFQGNDQVAMRQYGNSWQGAYSPRADTNLGILFARAEVGLQWQGYRLGVLQRGEALVEANRDTSDLVQQYQNTAGYDNNRSYQLDYHIRGFEADGLKISKSFQAAMDGQWQLDAGLGLSYLHGKRLKLETVTGQVVALNAKDFNASATQSDTNTGLDVSNPGEFNAPFGRRVGFSGQGYAVDAGIVVRHQTSGVRAEMAVADLFGRMDWKDVPNNVADYATATKYYDADGYAHFDPTATRTSSYRDVRQTLDPKLCLAVVYPWSHFELEGSTSYTRGYWFPQAGVGWQFHPDWAIQTDYDFRFSTIGVALTHQWIQLALRTDNTNLDAAKAYGLNARINIPL